jgi:hypothetical protein
MTTRAASPDLDQCPCCDLVTAPHLPGCPYGGLSISDAVRAHRHLGRPGCDQVPDLLAALPDRT